MTKLFKTLLDKDVSPKNWIESVLLPLYENGYVNNTDNYTAVFFFNNASIKLCGSIVNSRLQEWVEVDDITGEHQAGLKREFSTVDHIFTLLAIIQKQ